jgi:hypothetical protein
LTSLLVKFTYDHTHGVYYGQIGNGLKFLVRREHVGGSLENALKTFKRAEIEANSDRYVQRKPARKPSPYTYDETKVRRFPSGHTAPLPDLDIDLELDLGVLL